MHPEQAKALDSDGLRREFLIEEVFRPDAIALTYTHTDRMIVGGIMPTDSPLALGSVSAPGAEYFMELREAGIINIGDAGVIVVDGAKYEMGPRDGLYLGRGAHDVSFESSDAKHPAKFYISCVPAHRDCPTTRVTLDAAKKLALGSNEESNKRTICMYVHPEVVDSCQLAMGLTKLEPLNVWNTMPTHTHERRMEVYLYFGMEESTRVFHFMGEPSQTRHLIMANEQAAISPPWSIHSGVGTSAYTFIWAMAGENKTFTDMDAVPMDALR
jgi:4-deoxy-L-threo-5-hexosulose-uronate ketol-isomerase